MRIALPVVVIAVLVAGCGTGMGSSAGNEPKQINVPPGQLKTQIVGASPQQKEILLASLSGVGDRRIQTITVAKADPEWGAPDGVGVEFTPRPEAVDDMRTSWEAWLVGNAFAARSRESDLPPVAYVAIPDESSAIGDVGLERAGRGTAQEVAKFVVRLEAEAKHADAKVVEVEVLKPLGYAVAATLEVSDPAEFLDRRAVGLFESVGEPPGDLDLRFVDPKGHRVSESWNAGGGGSAWLRQDLVGCSPYLFSQSTLSKPPPCPDQSPSRQ
jgi:hypothetical protein